MALKLQQGQIWKQGDEFIRIVQLERLAVGYKIMKDLKSGEGAHLQATKKEFCRLIKGATIYDPKAGRGRDRTTARRVKAGAARPK